MSGRLFAHTWQVGNYPQLAELHCADRRTKGLFGAGLMSKSYHAHNVTSLASRRIAPRERTRTQRQPSLFGRSVGPLRGILHNIRLEKSLVLAY